MSDLTISMITYVQNARITGFIRGKIPKTICLASPTRAYAHTRTCVCNENAARNDRKLGGSVRAELQAATARPLRTEPPQRDRAQRSTTVAALSVLRGDWDGWRKLPAMGAGHTC